MDADLGSLLEHLSVATGIFMTTLILTTERSKIWLLVLLVVKLMSWLLIIEGSVAMRAPIANILLRRSVR